MEEIKELTDFDFYQALQFLKQLVIAYLLALPIGWDRDKAERGAGVRTFPLVAIASCGYALVGIALFGPNSDVLGRVLQGLITGIGFIGGGAILKNDNHVKGTSTAASIWATGAVGVAVAFHRYEIAATVALVTFLTFLMFKKVKKSEEGEYEDC